MIVSNYDENISSTTKCSISKSIIRKGVGTSSDYENDTRLTYHYQIKRPCKCNVVIDDSRDDNPTPLDLIVGKKFKLEFFEACLKTMLLSEIASFKISPDLLYDFPTVMKKLRDIRKGISVQKSHCCGMSMQDQGLGYSDLDELLKTPEELEFIFELIKVEYVGDYQKESWCMTETEKIDSLPKLQEEGNKLYVSGDYVKASEKYASALGLIEQLLLKEKPHDEAWEELDIKKIPLLLNYAQCKLINNEYYDTIEHTSEVLKRDPKNVKAFFRRAKAHMGAWNPDAAKNDFVQVKLLDSSLEKSVNKELTKLNAMIKEKDNADSNKLKGKLF